VSKSAESCRKHGAAVATAAAAAALGPVVGGGRSGPLGFRAPMVPLSAEGGPACPLRRSSRRRRLVGPAGAGGVPRWQSGLSMGGSVPCSSRLGGSAASS
jgi:hypothetical protein